eukprot:g5585.t1
MEGNVVVLDFGSQYTQLITRRIRELGVHSLLIPADSSLEKLKTLDPAAVVLSGGPRSVTDSSSALHLPVDFFDHCKSHQIPILGICYGLQVIVSALGGVVEVGSDGGEVKSQQCNFGSLLTDEETSSQQVWMSHYDTVTTLPTGFEIIATSDKGVIVAIEDSSLKIYGLQYHPEVSHSERGMNTIRNFVHEICQLKPNWTMDCVIKSQKREITKQVGEDDHVVCALSGGVDSTVAAVLVHEIIGSRQEQERVSEMFNDHLHLPVTIVDRSKQMLERLKGVVDPEQKRKLIGAEFIDAFKEFRDNLESKIGKKAKFLLQGTLYPDVIESCPPPGSNQKHSHTIKSHHNVGGLPPDLQFELIEPLKELFKDEVRKLGLLLGVPDQFIRRHPFPGPGLGVRILGDVTLENRLETLRLVDEVFIETIKEFNLYDEIWQAFAVFLPIRSVGVQGDRRTHSHVVGLRAVSSVDGMTADWYPFDSQFLRTVSSRICNQVKDVNRVVYDITSKPPGTIEWE